MYAHSKTARAAVANARKLLTMTIPADRQRAALERLEQEIQAKGMHLPGHARNRWTKGRAGA